MEEWKLPERFEAYAEGRKAGFLKMKAAKEAGYKVAGFFCTFTPLEVLDAAGLLCVSLCGMSNETVGETTCDGKKKPGCGNRAAKKPLPADQVQLRLCHYGHLPVHLLGGSDRCMTCWGSANPCISYSCPKALTGPMPASYG